MLWPALSPLAAKRQVILYDQRGRGESTSPLNPGSSTIEDDAGDVGALRRALGIRQWDVLGHSWGGGIAMLATTGDPAGVRKLVLVDAVGATSDWMAPLRANVLHRLSGEERDAVARIPEEALGAADAVLHSTYARAVYPAWFTDPDMAARFTPPQALSDTGAAVLARLRGRGYDWRQIVARIATPTLLVHGEEDTLPLAVSRNNSYMITNARFEPIPASGHMPFWEAPAPFFAIVDCFLSQVS